MPPAPSSMPRPSSLPRPSTYRCIWAPCSGLSSPPLPPSRHCNAALSSSSPPPSPGRPPSELAETNGARGIGDGSDALRGYPERRMRNRFAELPRGTYFGEDCLDDDGSSDEPVVVKLRVEVGRDKLSLDFAGSSPQRR